MEKIRLLGEDVRQNNFDKIVYNKGDRVNLTGYICNDFKNVTDDLEKNVQIINSDSIYSINQKVKVCIKDVKDDDYIEVIGKFDVKRSFIYLEPDNDKLINKDKDILEFNTNDNTIKISIVEMLKNQILLIMR